MSRTPKLSDIQLVLLSSASSRESGSLLPPPASLGANSDKVGKAIAGLIKKDLARETTDAANDASWRSEGDLKFGAVITDAGRAAIGVGETDEAASPTPAPQRQPQPSKRAAVISLLQREQGATLDELIETTGWLPHTTRAALTGLRKKGEKIERSKRDDITCYRIVSPS